MVAPALIGLDRGQSEAALKVAGLALGDVTDAFAATATAGIVVSQTPTAGADMAGSSTVAIVVSKGPEFVSVPSVTGKSKTDAVALLEAAGLKVKTADKNSKTKKGSVFAQSPAAGKLAQPGGIVTISVSTGVELVKVPDVDALDRALAGRGIDASDNGAEFWSDAWFHELSRLLEKYYLTRLGLRVTAVPAGPRYGQTPSAGKMVARGTRITYHVEGGE